jgi:hypothetical protein
MTLRTLLIERVLSCLTEEDLAEHYTSAAELDTLSDIDLFELYEQQLFKALL